MKQRYSSWPLYSPEEFLKCHQMMMKEKVCVCVCVCGRAKEGPRRTLLATKRERAHTHTHTHTHTQHTHTHTTSARWSTVVRFALNMPPPRKAADGWCCKDHMLLLPVPRLLLSAWPLSSTTAHAPHTHTTSPPKQQPPSSMNHVCTQQCPCLLACTQIYGGKVPNKCCVCIWINIDEVSLYLVSDCVVSANREGRPAAARAGGEERRHCSWIEDGDCYPPTRRRIPRNK